MDRKNIIVLLIAALAALSLVLISCGANDDVADADSDTAGDELEYYVDKGKLEAEGTLLTMTVDVSDYVSDGIITYSIKDNTYNGYATEHGSYYCDAVPILFRLVDGKWQEIARPEKEYGTGAPETGPIEGTFKNFEDGKKTFTLNTDVFGELPRGTYMLYFVGKITPPADSYQGDDYYTEWTAVAASAVFELPER